MNNPMQGQEVADHMSIMSTQKLVVCIVDIDTPCAPLDDQLLQDAQRSLPVIITDKSTDPQRFTVYSGKTTGSSLHSAASSQPLTPEPSTHHHDSPIDDHSVTLAKRDFAERTTRLTVSANGTIARQTVADVVTRGSVRDVLFNDVLIEHVPGLWDNEDVTILNHFLMPKRSDALVHDGVDRKGIKVFRRALGDFLEQCCRQLLLEAHERTTPFFTHVIQVTLSVVAKQKISGIMHELTQARRGGNGSSNSGGSGSRHTVTVDTIEACASLGSLLNGEYLAASATNGPGNELVSVVVSLAQSLQGHPTRVSRLRIVDLGARTLDDPIMSTIESIYAKLPPGPQKPSLPHNAAGALARRSTRTRPTPPPSSTPAGSASHFRIAYESDSNADGMSADDEQNDETESEVLRRVSSFIAASSNTSSRSKSGVSHVLAMLHVSVPHLYEAIDHIHRCTFVKDDAPFVVEDSFLDCLELLSAYKHKREALSDERDDLLAELAQLSQTDSAKDRLRRQTVDEVGLDATGYRRRHTEALRRELLSKDEAYSKQMEMVASSVFAVDGVVYQSVTSGLRVNIAERHVEAARGASIKAEARRRSELAAAHETVDAAREALKAAQERLLSLEQQLSSDTARLAALRVKTSDKTDTAVQVFDETRKTTLLRSTSEANHLVVEQSSTSEAPHWHPPPLSARSGNSAHAPHQPPQRAAPQSICMLAQPHSGTAASSVQRGILQDLVREAENVCRSVEEEVTTLHKHKAAHSSQHEAMLEYRLLSERVLKELMLMAQQNHGGKPMRPVSARGTGGRPQLATKAPATSR